LRNFLEKVLDPLEGFVVLVAQLYLLVCGRLIGRDGQLLISP
jgi:hypothetical protein